MNDDNKIGILTLHSGFNEGAILQAFCIALNLQKVFEKSRVEIIDHRYKSKTRAYGPIRDDKTRALSDFIGNSLPLSSKAFPSDDHRETFEFIKKNYGAVVTGSDELWKLRYTSRFFGLISEQKDPWCPAFPNVYWPDENIKAPKIAYSASIGQTDWRGIPKRHAKLMRDILSGFRLLGIRDRRTTAFLEWLDPELAARAEWVPDPTFSVDILSLVDRELLRQKLQDWGVDFDRPRICTILADDPNVNSIISEFKNKGFQIVGLSLPNRIADVPLYNKGLTPLEWAGVFGLMDFCISQRMHACISCILNETPFAAVDYYGNPADDDTKIKDLMRSFNLLPYYYNAGRDSLERFREISADLAAGCWPANETADKLYLFQNRSKEFTAKIKATLERVEK